MKNDPRNGASSAPLLEAENLGKEFTAAGRAVRVLSGVSLRLAPGETVAVTGPSGSGKSSLLALLAGLDRPTAGRVLYRARALSEQGEEELAAWRRRAVGFVFQNFRLIESLTALENAQLPLELAGLCAAEARAAAERSLAQLGLAERGGHFPAQLSGGEQQRVAIARAYAHGPELLFADEPTGSLDRATAARVLDDLLAFNARGGAALVLVTHDPAVAARLDRTVVLQDGALR